MNPQLSQIEYLDQSGDICPFCKSPAVTAITDFDTAGDKAWRTIECRDCGKEWDDVFTLTGYDTTDKNQ
jgi:formate dehydrogenase maturation protein FdhE